MTFRDYVEKELELFHENDPPQGVMAEWCKRNHLGVKATISLLSIAQFIRDGTLMTKKEGERLERILGQMRREGVFNGEENGNSN